MIKLFFNKRGSGKSKALIEIANENINKIDGNSVFIDNDKKRMLCVKPQIRFISMKEYPLKSNTEFSAFLCGVLSSDYDIQNLYIDNLSKIIKDFDIKVLVSFLDSMKEICSKYNVNVFISVHDEGQVVPDKLKEYIAS